MMKNVGQSEIVFPVNYKINILIMKIDLRFHFPSRSKLINQIFTLHCLVFATQLPPLTCSWPPVPNHSWASPIIDLFF